MKKLRLILSAIALTLICSNCTTISTITLLDDNEYETEWNDGKLWAYETDKDYMLGIAINPAKDQLGVFQINLIVQNNTDKTLTFDPDRISVQLAQGAKSNSLAIYEYPLTPNVEMAAYDMGENIYQLSKSAQLPVYESTTKEIPITNESITTESDGNTLWSYQNIGEYTIGAALCSSKDDPDNYQLKLSVKQPDGTPIQIKCKDITATYAYGMKTGELQTGNFRTSRKQDKTEFTGYITRYKTNYGPDPFIIVVRIPIGNEIASFQWSVINN